jgi:CheY-like chemotaxis protein
MVIEEPKVVTKPDLKAFEKSVKILYVGSSPESLPGLQTDPRISFINKGNTLEASRYLEKSNRPDAILCDAVLSGSDGMSFYSDVRANNAYNNVAFIMLSYEFRDDLFKQAFLKGVDDFYVYPLPETDKLISRIEFLKSFRQRGQHSVDTVQQKHQEYIMPRSKRIFDLLVATGALIALSPILLIVMLAIRLESRGRIYYTSKRVGREPFDFYKFRSMRVGADSELTKLAKEKNQYATSPGQSDIDFSKSCPRCSQLPDGDTCSPLLHIGPQMICDYWYTFQKKEIAKTKSAFVNPHCSFFGAF